MSTAAGFFHSALVERTGWMLIHFLWQGLLAALGLRLVFGALKHGSPAVRYSLACGTLAAMLLAPPVTFWALADPGLAATASPREPTRVEDGRPTPSRENPDAAIGRGPGLYQATTRFAREAQLWAAAAFRPWLGYAVAAWLVGVSGFSSLLVAGLWRVARVLRTATDAQDDRVRSAFERVQARLRVRRRVGLRESTWVDVPAVVGWLRPVILMPASALTGLPPEQLELVFAHELAHIRRHDYAVNVLQNIAETLLFFHPAVWWVSRSIRAEREMCCDDLAIESCGDRVLYARTLTALEELRAGHSRAAVAANGGSLLERIRRLAGASAGDRPRRLTVGFTAAFAALLLAAGTFSSLGSASNVERAPQNHLDTQGKLNGLIRDESGRPIAAAAIKLQHLSWRGAPDEPKAAKLAAMSTITDATGRWTMTGFPPRVHGSILLEVDHPGFVHAQFFSPADSTLGNLEAWASALILKPGIQLEGVVTGREGRPVEGARVRFGRVDSGLRERAATDASGRFRMDNAEAGNVVLVIQAAGHASWLEAFVLPSSRGPVEVRLEAARTIRGRVVDGDGKPVANAGVCADRWRGQTMLELVNLSTDPGGRFAWLEAPSEAVSFDIWKDGHLGVRKRELLAGKAEHEIVLLPALRLSGVVRDARTLQPIGAGTIEVGADGGHGRVHWLGHGTASFRDGRFEKVIDMPISRSLWPDSRGYVLRAMATGYRPVVSPPFLDTAGTQRCDLLVEPLSSVTWQGVVRTPGGQPAPGARVVLCDASEGLNPRALDTVSADATTETDGSFSLAPRALSRGIIVIQSAGWATATAEDLAAAKDITLEAWGRVEGTLRVRGTPAANERIEVLAEFSGASSTLARPTPASTRTDAAGCFVVDRLPRGYWTFSRTTEGVEARTVLGKRKRVSVPAGEIVRVELDGTCATVEGRVRLPAELERSAKHGAATVRFQPETSGPPASNGELLPSFLVRVASDGRFSCTGIPIGKYRLYCEVREARLTHESLPRARVAAAESEVSIGAEILDRGGVVSVGTISLEPIRSLRLDEPVPAFAGSAMNGEHLRLEDFAGKFVLLHFWASWCGPCREQVRFLKRAQAEFGNDARLVVLGVNLDQDLEAARRAVVAEDMGWPHLAAGDQRRAGVAKDFGIDGIPSIFLLGRRGELIAKDLAGDAVYSAAAQALGNAGAEERER